MSGGSPERAEFESLGFEELVERYRSGSSRLDARVLELSDEQLDRCFLPDAGVGRWSCRMLLGHLADAELINAVRMRKICAEPGCEVVIWDQDAYIDAGLYAGSEHPAPGFIAVIHTVRLWASEWLASLPVETRHRRGLHLTRGEMSLSTLVEFAAWHLEHHAWYLGRKVARLTAGSAPR